MKITKKTYKANEKIILRFMKETNVYKQWLDEFESILRKNSIPHHTDTALSRIAEGKMEAIDCVISYSNLLFRIRRSQICPEFFQRNVCSALFRVFYKIVYHSDFIENRYKLKQRHPIDLEHEFVKAMSCTDFIEVLKEIGVSLSEIETMKPEIIKADRKMNKRMTDLL